jgi:bifunctional DNA-binding transcriptional regulator/antitoxin component of YhaV-PrlF toxin-antitoxin module
MANPRPTHEIKLDPQVQIVVPESRKALKLAPGDRLIARKEEEVLELERLGPSQNTCRNAFVLSRKQSIWLTS